MTERERIGDLIALALSNGHSSLRQYAVIHRTRILRAADAVATDKAADLRRYGAIHHYECGNYSTAGLQGACTCGLDAKLAVTEDGP